MYKSIIRPLLFLMQPETIHHVVAGLLRFAGKIPGGRALMRLMYGVSDPSLEREVFGIRFPNPVGIAAGFDKDASLFREMPSLGFGFVEVGTVTPLPQPGNPRPRLFRLRKDNALINRMGFNNKGLENMVVNLRRHHKKAVIGCNLGKNTSTSNDQAPADYLKLFRALYEYADYFVVNVSCPNVKDLACLQNRESVMRILDPLFDFRRGQNEYRPVLLKISPDLSDSQIDEMVDIMIETPLDGMIATNTTTSRTGLQTRREALDKIGNGGLSGAPLTERSIQVVRRIHSRSEGRYPIIGVGGIMTPDDAARMLEAGASLVQVYTGFIYNGPAFARRICRRIAVRQHK